MIFVLCNTCVDIDCYIRNLEPLYPDHSFMDTSKLNELPPLMIY